MDKANPLSSPMIVRSLDVKQDLFRPFEKGKELLSPEDPLVYLCILLTILGQILLFL